MSGVVADFFALLPRRAASVHALLYLCASAHTCHAASASSAVSARHTQSVLRQLLRRPSGAAPPRSSRKAARLLARSEVLGPIEGGKGLCDSHHALLKTLEAFLAPASEGDAGVLMLEDAFDHAAPKVRIPLVRVLDDRRVSVVRVWVWVRARARVRVRMSPHPSSPSSSRSCGRDSMVVGWRGGREVG